jgi:hypothetical protein
MITTSATSQTNQKKKQSSGARLIEEKKWNSENFQV